MGHNWKQGGITISTTPVVDKVLPAMPIRLRYHALEREILEERRTEESIFHFEIPAVFTPGWDFYPLNAYSVRDWFEKVKTPEEGFSFFKATGDFRLRRTGSARAALTWSEFQRWQALIQRIRLRKPSEGPLRLGAYRPDDAEDEAELKDSFLRSEFLSKESSETIEQIWDVADDTFDWLRGVPVGLSIERDMYLSYEETVKIFSSQGAGEHGSRAWRDAQRTLAQRRAARATGNAEGQQNLYAQVITGTSLDAILSTIYVDNLRGIETRVCALKDCEVLFPVESKHEKQYCTPEHASYASKKRKRAEVIK